MYIINRDLTCESTVICEILIPLILNLFIFPFFFFQLSMISNSYADSQRPQNSKNLDAHSPMDMSLQVREDIHESSDFSQSDL